MGTYVVRRLLLFIPTTVGAMFLLHYLTSLSIQTTANPARALFGDRTPSDTQLQALTESLGLGDPCLGRFGDPCIGLFGERLYEIFFHFDFGVNLRFRPVTEIIAEALPFTVKLVIIAIIFETIVGITAGVLAGLNPDKFLDYTVKISTVLIISIPVFVLGAIVQVFVGLKIGDWARGADWIPDAISQGVLGAVYRSEYPWLSLLVPGMVLGALSLATVARLTRTSILENIRSDYVRTAKAKGLTKRRVIGVHTLRNSLIPVVTYLGLDFGNLLTGALITEGIFGVPGLGRRVFDGIRTNDPSVVLGIATFMVLVFLVANLIVDILYAVLDPRIRYE